MFILFIFERERERERERAGEGQKERETENSKQAVGCQHSYNTWFELTNNEILT